MDGLSAKQRDQRSKTTFVRQLDTVKAPGLGVFRMSRRDKANLLTLSLAQNDIRTQTDED